MQTLIDTGKSRLWVYENYIQDLYDDVSKLPLEHKPPIFFMGKQCSQNRNVGFFSDESVGYNYSTQIMKSQPLSVSPLLEELLPKINESLGTNFNGILVNQYVDGTMCVGAHSDDEAGLDKNTKMVASISFGATRTFRVRDKNTKQIVLDYPHKARTLLVMEGDFQSEFKHEIPVQKKVKEDRISLTFRHHTK